MTPPFRLDRLDAANTFFDRWRWVGAAVAFLSIFGFSVMWPGQRITHLEQAREVDHEALVATTGYLRILATAQCLSDSIPTNNLMQLLCTRVLNDPSVLALPSP